jgi:hypothetical protein
MCSRPGHRMNLWRGCIGAVLLLLVFTASARAERRGINVTIVKTDGTRVSGELFAVRTNSVVVQEAKSEAGFLFIPTADIRYIEKIRMSAFKGAAAGFVQWGFFGLCAGDVIAFNKPSSRKRASAILGGLIGGSIGAFFGGLKGAPTKGIQTVDIEGQPRDVAVAALRKLGQEARIRDVW